MADVGFYRQPRVGGKGANLLFDQNRIQMKNNGVGKRRTHPLAPPLSPTMVNWTKGC